MSVLGFTMSDDLAVDRYYSRIDKHPARMIELSVVRGWDVQPQFIYQPLQLL